MGPGPSSVVASPRIPGFRHRDAAAFIEESGEAFTFTAQIEDALAASKDFLGHSRRLPEGFVPIWCELVRRKLQGPLRRREEAGPLDGRQGRRSRRKPSIAFDDEARQVKDEIYGLDVVVVDPCRCGSPLHSGGPLLDQIRNPESGVACGAGSDAAGRLTPNSRC